MEAATLSARDEILSAAIPIFARKGYAGTGVQEILDAAHLSKPTLYYYFGNKAGLFHAILDSAYDDSFALMKLAVKAGTSVEEQLAGAAAALFEFTETHRDLTRLVLATIFAAPEEVPPEAINTAKRRQNFDMVLGVFEQARSRGEVDPLFDLDDLAHGFLGAVSHRIRTHLLTGEGDLDRQLAEKIVLLFMNGARERK